MSQLVGDSVATALETVFPVDIDGCITLAEPTAAAGAHVGLDDFNAHRFPFVRDREPRLRLLRWRTRDHFAAADCSAVLRVDLVGQIGGVMPPRVPKVRCRRIPFQKSSEGRLASLQASLEGVY